jgi:uroporphyrinogen decarboxylase
MFEERSSVPVWLMRQAGRYQKSYRDLKEKYSFEEFCKKPELAAMLTMNALEEFHFDAGIVFSDLLFPLESIGCDLLYNPGPIVVEHDFTLCPENFFSFQEEAIRLIPKSKPLLGFIGGPYTLYAYLHKNVEDLYSDKYKEFCFYLKDSLLKSIYAQRHTDCICIFETSLGDISYLDFTLHVVPFLENLVKESQYKGKWMFFSRNTTVSHYKAVQHLFDVLAFDWHFDLAEMFQEFPHHFIQGNLHPRHLFASSLKDVLLSLLQSLPYEEAKKRLIFNLGHGVLKETSEDAVREVMSIVKKFFTA